jgi:two-component system alkaline phosphatase synthesis response regulator PhoP
VTTDPNASKSNPDPAPAAAPAAPPTDPSSAPTEPDYADCTILIVDDNSQNVELLQAYLEIDALPCRIATASDGIEALAMIDDANEPLPDVILLDIMMPKMSGYEVCRKLKEDPKTRSIPIIMVTALNELGDIERGVECGTDDFLTKPVNKLELITRVKSLLRVRHLKKEFDRAMAYIQDMKQDPGEGTGRIDQID